MRPGDSDGPFPKSVFPTSVFLRRIFPWMGGDDGDEEVDEEGDEETSNSAKKSDRGNI